MLLKSSAKIINHEGEGKKAVFKRWERRNEGQK